MYNTQTAEAVFKICKTYADAMYVCLMLNMDKESDAYLDAIYDALQDRFNPELYASAQAAQLLNYVDAGQTVAEAEDELVEDEQACAFSNWLAEQLNAYTWPVDKFIRVMQDAVCWMDVHGADYDMSDMINTVFEDATLDNGEVTFVAFTDAINKAIALS